MWTQNITLICDVEHAEVVSICASEIHGTLPEGFEYPVTLKDVRKQAKKLGWTFSRGLDFCPDCKAGLPAEFKAER